MKVEISRIMIATAITNVETKLAEGHQKEKIYYNKDSEDSYLVNNVLGELAEMAFEKAVVDHGYALGVDIKKFGTFKNSDLCDFYGSKTGKTIDIKSSHKKATDLLVTKQIGDWRPVDEYVLVKLHPSSGIERHTLESLQKVTYATIEGGARYTTINKDKNLIKIAGRDVYKLPKSNFDSPEYIIERNFFKSGEHVERYIPKGKLELHIASIENGSVARNSNVVERVNVIADFYKNKSTTLGKGHFNFVSPFRNGRVLRESRIVISFAIYDNDKFSTPLFLNTLFQAEATAYSTDRTLVIPSYIEEYIPKNHLQDVCEIINNLECNVDCDWSFKRNNWSTKRLARFSWLTFLFVANDMVWDT